MNGSVLDGEPTVRLELLSEPQTLTLVRGMLSGVGELLAIDPELLDDLKTALSEACNNVMVHAYPEAVGTFEVLLYLAPDCLEAVVRDHGAGIGEARKLPDSTDGIGFPLMRALSETLHVEALPAGGTEVRMKFMSERGGRPLLEPPDRPAADGGFDRELAGVVIASLSPVRLLAGVMGRLARAMAAGARFSLDRFSDIYLVTDAIAAHAATSAAGRRIYFALDAQDRRLEVSAGPFRGGSGSLLSDTESRSFPLGLLTDELIVEPVGDDEILRAAVIDSQD